MLEKINNTQLGYLDIGFGENCLFLHGNRDCKEVFKRMIPFLKNEYHMMFMDYRGHGESDICIDGFGYDQFILDIDTLLCEKNVKKINLIGHSLGGVLSLLYYLKFPEKVNSIVLMGTSSHFVSKFKRPKRGTVITQSCIKDTNALAKPFFFTPTNKDVEKEIVNNWSNLSATTHENMIKMGHIDLRCMLEQVKCNVLLIVGGQDKICSVEEGEYMNSKIPNSSLKIIPNTGHYMFMENPQMTSSLINEFLGKFHKQ